MITVFPGRTATPMQEEVHRYEGRDYDPERFLQPRDVAAAVLNALALPRTAEVTDLHIRPMQGARYRPNDDREAERFPESGTRNGFAECWPLTKEDRPEQARLSRKAGLRGSRRYSEWELKANPLMPAVLRLR